MPSIKKTMKTFKEYISEGVRGVVLKTSGGLTSLKPAQPSRMDQKITDWMNAFDDEESDTTWRDLAIALDFGNVALWERLLTDKKSGSPLSARVPDILTELAKILGAKLDAVQKAWKNLGRDKKWEEFDDPAYAKKWASLKSR